MKLAEDITTNDLAQWIDAGYFYVTVGGDERICRVLNWPGQNMSGEFVVQDITNGENISVRNLQHITLHWPVCGYVNLLHSKFAVHLRRLQRRQWCRTYNTHCVSLSVPSLYTVRRTIGDTSYNALRDKLRTNNPQIVKYVFDPTYYSYQEADHLMRSEGWASVALTSNCLLCKTANGQHDVYYRQEFAGTIDGGQLDPVSETLTKKILKVMGGYVRV